MSAVAFTGYRPEKMPFGDSKTDEHYLRFREVQMRVITRLIERGYTDYISGVAQGFDTWVAEDILLLQKKYRNLSLECAIPYPNQAKAWPFSEQRRRYRILTKCTSSVILSDRYTKDCFFVRNRYMVDKADVVVCAYDGQKGGTAYGDLGVFLNAVDEIFELGVVIEVFELSRNTADEELRFVAIGS